jgi:hypothetical protein
MTERDPIEERLRRMGLPDPAPDLRRRLLAAAAPHVRSTTTWADRVWFSGRWRLAAVALVVAVVGLDRIPVTQYSGRADAPGFAAMETARAAEEAARQVGLSPDQAAVLARRALVAASRPAPQEGLSALGLGP